MTNATIEYINKLKGMKVSNICHSANMVCIEFGNKKQVQGHRKNTRFVSEYVLHIQCVCRLIRRKEILFASADLYVSDKSSTEETVLLDKKISCWLKTSDFITVENLILKEMGDLTMELNTGDIVEILVDTSSSEEECWRFFQPYSNSPHLIVYGNKMELES